MATQIGAIPVTLGNLPLSAVDDAGVTWLHTDLKGWSSPGLRAELQPRQADHGAWASPVYLDARPITITGMIAAPTTAARDAAVEQLIAAASLTDTVLTVEDSIPKQATVRRSGEVLVELLGLYGATYSLIVTAPDPRRYSTVLQSQSTALPSTSGGLSVPLSTPLSISTTTVSGSITLVHEGTIGTRPVFTVTGPVTNPTITVQYPDGTVRALLYSSSLEAGDELVIDTDLHSVVLNGAVSRRLYLSGQWPEIPPGTAVTVGWYADSYDANALLTGSCRSAWM